MPQSLLIVDDDERLRDLLMSYLEDNGFVVLAVETAAFAKEALYNAHFDLMILDITMPGQDGLSLTQELRKADNQTPILLLTARGNTDDRIMGFELGADDYLSKPFEPKELLLRIKSILKRQNNVNKTQFAPLKSGNWNFKPNHQRLLIADDEITLTQSEAKLLEVLWKNNGSAVSREILTDIFGADYFSRSIDILVTRLRKKIGDDSKKPTYLKTIRNKGYLLNLPS